MFKIRVYLKQYRSRVVSRVDRAWVGMATVISWKTIAVGAFLVAFTSVFDFRDIGVQMTTLRSLHKCRIPYAAFSKDALSQAMRDFAKKTHPDVAQPARGGAVCTVEEANEIRMAIREHGAVGWPAWVLYKLNISPARVEPAIMLTLIGTGCACAAGIRHIPPRYTRWLVVIGLLQQGETAASTERRLMKKLKHGEYTYGNPPCSTHCGEVPSQCTVDGWMYADVSDVNHT